MIKGILTLIDVSGIQDYVFTSNRLVDNTGASRLVEMAVKYWPKELIQNIPCAKLVFAAGGNAAIVFPDIDAAKGFIRKYTRKVYQKAPGLRLAVVHSEFSDQDVPRDVFVSALSNLDRKKRNLPPESSALNIAVTAVCHESGLAGEYTDTEDPEHVISGVTQSKRDAAGFPERVKIPDTYLFSKDLDELGEIEGESNYIAVVHVDLNDMGKRIRDEILPLCDSDFSPLGDFSQKIDQAVTGGFQELLDKLITVLPGLEEAGNINIRRRSGQTIIPLRPLVLGGDDVTFVCNGRLGLWLASELLEIYRQKSVFDKHLNACAGVAIVKHHYPFFRAYQLAEELCANAKNFVKHPPNGKVGFIRPSPQCAIDWHFASTGPVTTINDIRRREYTVYPDRRLFARPVFLHHPETWRTWQNIRALIKHFQSNDFWSRNKIKKFREVMRAVDSNTVKHFMEMYALKLLPEIDSDRKDFSESGWSSEGSSDGIFSSKKITPYFDAIELMDIYTEPTVKDKGEEIR